ncbi:MAG: nitroreductase family deazaflavin-dependent oxidoreductase [Anaerolineae bacterium]|nr:nitroreductase family deazaflavin-dependent oxidoreductase [Anaerolineae bacterium]
MASENTKVRPWTWTPPPAMNQLMFILLRLPVVHRVISKAILLISFTGQKSGKRYSTPVGYLQEGNNVIILTKRFRQWWHNFEQPAPVEMRIKGRDYQGQATALTDVETMIPLIVLIVQVHRPEAEIYGIKLLDNGKPDINSVQEIAPKLVVIQVEMKP